MFLSLSVSILLPVLKELRKYSIHLCYSRYDNLSTTFAAREIASPSYVYVDLTSVKCLEPQLRMTAFFENFDFRGGR